MAPSGRVEQLSLAIEGDEAPRLPRRLRPMVPLAGGAPFDDAAYFFEPGWPGTSVLLYVESGGVRLQGDHLVDPLVAFPELAGLGRQFRHHGLIVEGTLLALDEEGRPDAELLRARLADAGVAGGGDERACTAAFVGSDLLYRDGAPIFSLPFEERRAQLARELVETDNCVVSRGLRGEGLTLADAVRSMGLAEISARLLSAPYRPGQQHESWLRLPVVEPVDVPTRPFLALLQRLPL